ncbi:MAG: hypothetical protein ACXAB4_14400, partial [Candidatus Hodarchaeales archaeon]
NSGAELPGFRRVLTSPLAKPPLAPKLASRTSGSRKIITGIMEIPLKYGAGNHASRLGSR